MPEFTFEEENHIYRLDGVKIPSVSEIIAPLHDFSKIPSDRLEKAAQYGKAVHKVIELWLKGTLGDYDELLEQPLNEFKKFWDLSKYNEAEIEKKFYSNARKYAGTIDIIDFEKIAIIDIKTRKYDPITDDLQLTAYEDLHFSKCDKYILELLPNKPYNLVKVQNKQAKSMFLYMLEYWHKTNEFKNKLEGWKNAK